MAAAGRRQLRSLQHVSTIFKLSYFLSLLTIYTLHGFKKIFKCQMNTYTFTVYGQKPSKAHTWLEAGI